MSRNNNAVLPVVMILSVLALSACATKTSEPAVVEPVPVAIVAEKAPVVEPAPAPAPAAVVEEPAPVPVVAAAQPAVKPMVRKAKRKAAAIKAAQPKAVEPEPVAAPAPAPVVKPAAPVVSQPEAAPPVVNVQPAPKAAEPGFLQKYWLWLFGIIIAVVAYLWLKKKD